MSRLASCAVWFALCTLSPAGAAAQELRWRSGGVLERPVQRERPARADLLRRLSAGAERHVLVRFERSPSARERQLWGRAGIELGHALGGGAFFARVGELDSGALARLTGLVDARELELEWKLHPTLLAGETPPWTVVALDESGQATVAVYVLLHAGVALEQGDVLLTRLGGSTFDLLESVNGIVALLPRARRRARGRRRGRVGRARPAAHGGRLAAGRCGAAAPVLAQGGAQRALE